MTSPVKAPIWPRIVAIGAISTAVVMVVIHGGGTLDGGQPRRHVSAGPAVSWPLDIRYASVRQVGPDLRIAMRTKGAFSAASLSGRPGSSLCLNLHRAVSGAAVRRICLALRNGRATLVRDDLSAAGIATASRDLHSTISRPTPQSLVARVPASAAGLGLGPYRWQAVSSWNDSSGCSGPGCAAVMPALPAPASVHDPIPVGCVEAGRSYRVNGARAARSIGLSFDDGPSIYTPAVLRELKRHKAHATFFQVGINMGGQAALQRRILKEGHSLADHSWSHPILSGGGAFADAQIARTKSRIAAQTGFTPCLFRAPYGAVSKNLIAIARSHGLLTIEWDVDPIDWSRPGADSIAARVLRQVRRGSIILMHDGGGNRSQTVAALGPILSTIAKRGLKAVSVETLLGLRPVYR